MRQEGKQKKREGEGKIREALCVRKREVRRGEELISNWQLHSEA